MRQTCIAFALVAGIAALPAQAEVLELPATAPATTPAPAPVTAGPARGSAMAQVRRQYGEPALKHGTVGGSSRQQPPITRWDYPEFTVVFERDKVIDVQVKGEPMPVQNPDALATPSP